MGFPGGSGQFSSVTQSCTTLCDPMDFSKPGFSVHHQLPELAQTHVHQVDDAIQPSHPLSSPSPPAFNLCQYQSLFFKKKIIYFNWRLITLQCCGGFCHTLTWISHRCTCVPHPSGLSQCTGFECPVSCIKLGLVIYFTYGNIHVSVLFSQIIPPSPSPTESKSLFFTSVSLLLSCI